MFQCECEGCGRALYDTDERKFYRLCAACAEEQERETSARYAGFPYAASAELEERFNDERTDEERAIDEETARYGVYRPAASWQLGEERSWL